VSNAQFNQRSRSDGYTVAMVAACPFPANHGSAASIREMSDTLSDMGQTIAENFGTSIVKGTSFLHELL